MPQPDRPHIAPQDLDRLLPICMTKLPPLQHDHDPKAWAQRALDLLEAVCRERQERYNY